MPAVSSLNSWHSLRRLVFYRLPSELAEGGPREVQTCNKRGLVDDHLAGSGARAARGLVLKQPSQILELGAALPASALVAKRTTARHAPARPTRRGTQMPIAPTVSAVFAIEEVCARSCAPVRARQPVLLHVYFVRAPNLVAARCSSCSSERVWPSFIIL